jgi:hypothetical protein
VEREAPPRRSARPGPAEGPAISRVDYYGRPGRPRRPARDDDYDDDRDDDYDDRPPPRRRRYDFRRRQEREDLDQLRILAILYYVWGGLACVGALFALLWMGFMTLLFSAAPSGPSGPPAAVGVVFLAFGAFALLLAGAVAGCLIYAGRCLAQQKHYMFCFVMACLSCLQVPLGTLLGVFTLVVLSRPSVKDLFEAARDGGPPDDRRDD